MNLDTFYILSDDARLALVEHRLGDALSALQGMASCVGNSKQAETLANVRENYSRMLDYLQQGAKDERRSALFHQFLLSAQESWHLLRRDAELLTTERTTHYAATRHTLEHMDVPHEMAALLTHSTVSARVLFECVWTSGMWSDEDLHVVCQLFDRLAPDDRLVLLGATMLACLHFFDIRKLLFLIRLSADDTMPIRARALVGAVLITLRWAQDCSLYPELATHWTTLAKSVRFQTELADLQGQLLLTLETKRIEHKVQDEIIPEMMKQTGKLRTKQMGTADWQNELNRLSANPEWTNRMERFSDKMHELIDMQRKGVDIFIGSFKMLKQRFPFFSVAANWFCPFNLSHPDLPATVKRNAFAEFLLTNNQLCDSDKYSFALTLGQLPSTGLLNLSNEQLAGALGGDVASAMKASNGSKQTMRDCLSSYVQDLYRFFKLFRYRDKQVDPFSSNLLLTTYAPFANVLQHYSGLQSLADFAFSVECYAFANEFYKVLPPSAEILQRRGYCEQVAGDYRQAAETYERANLTESGSQWTLRQMAACYRRIGEFEKARAAYAELEKLAPEEPDVALRIGECFIGQGRFDEALQPLYKAYYLLPDDGRVLRALAWCCLQTGEENKAEDYYAKLLSNAPQPDDFLNAGHAAWMAERIDEAVLRYKTYLAKSNYKGLVDDIFAEDLNLLATKGISGDDIRLMSDVLKAAHAAYEQ